MTPEELLAHARMLATGGMETLGSTASRWRHCSAEAPWRRRRGSNGPNCGRSAVGR